jgi:hypothetical protein
MLLAFCGMSCSTPGSTASPAPNSGKYYLVSAREAAFFRYGPQQANGPDERLPHGTLVGLLRTSFGYSEVQLMNGVQGYVASQDLHTAPPEVVRAATNPNPTASATSEANRNRRFHNMVDPRFLPPPPLPEDQPEPTPIPGAEASPTP